MTTGTGTPRSGDVKRLVQDARQILDPLHEIIVLGAMAGDAGRVAFLEGVGADQMRRHLAGDADKRDRIHQRVGEAGHRICRAGPGGNKQHADLAGRTRITFRRMSRALLVADEDVPDRILMKDRVVDRQNGAAGIAEYDVDALILQGFDHHFGTAQLLHHGPSPSREFEQQKRPG